MKKDKYPHPLTYQGSFHRTIIFAFALLCLISLNATAQINSAFVTTWVVGNANFGDGDLSITIPTNPTFTNYSYTVNWGDGNMNTGLTGDAEHTYATAGTYEISITGTFPAIYFDGGDGGGNLNNDDANKIQTIKQWGTNPWASMENAFSGCSNLNIEPGAGNPVLSGVTNMSGMFTTATVFNSNISSWDVSSVTDMSGMFEEAAAFNQNISGWNVSGVIDMSAMFENAATFNSDISDWDVSSVIDMRAMFEEAAAFNRDLSGWDVSSVTNMRSMFEGVTLSTENYDTLLVGWSTIDSDEGALQSGVVFHGGNSRYCAAGETARDMLINNYNWDIEDGERDTSANCVENGGNSGTNPPVIAPTDSAFVTTWVVGDGDFSITIPTSPNLTYSYTVHWGDGRMDSDLTGDAEHTYDRAGTYTVSITGIFPAIYFDANDDANKILTIKQWGTNPWVSMVKAFAGCSNLNIELGAGNPVLSGVTDMSGMFEEAAAFNGDLSGWDVSSVTNMSGMFEEAVAFNSDLSGWDVSNVTDMEEMFEEATTFNQNISDWNVSSVTNMRSMFEEATAFNQNISDWVVSNVTDMGDMFEEATAFNKNISDWVVSNVTNMSGMFAGAVDFNQNISSWDVSNVTDMSGMFEDAAAFNGDLSRWDVSRVTDMSEMFAEAIAFNQNISGWDVSNVTNMSEMFAETEEFNGNLSGWDVSRVRNMEGMFRDAFLSTENYDALLVGWSTIDSDESVLQTTVTFSGGNSQYCTAGAAARNVLTSTPNNWVITDGGVDMSAGCANFLQPTFFVTTWVVGNNNFGDGDLSITIPTNPDFASSYSYTVNWGDGNIDTGLTGDITHSYTTTDTYTVSITGTFPAIYFNSGDGGNGLDNDANKIQTIKQWGTNPWASMKNAFSGCSNLNIEPGAGNPVLSGVTNMSGMFTTATVFNSNISGWDVSSVTDMSGMFEEAAAFNQDISGWNVSGVIDMSAMFENAATFNSDLSDWNVSSVTNMRAMFEEAVAFNQNISDWYVSNVTNMSGMFKGAIVFNSDLSDWNVRNVTNMSEMFAGAIAFNQNISDWNVSNVVDMSGMFRDVTLSTANYDTLLVGWSTIDSDESTLQTTVTFSGGNSQYCTAGASARNVLTGTPNNWIITDGRVDMSGICDEVTFGSGSIADQTYHVGDDVDFILPKAALGTPPYSYALDGEIPAGLAFDTTTRTLIGTPTAETDAVELIYTVTDSTSMTATTDTLIFAVTIIEDLILRIKVFLEGAQ